MGFDRSLPIKERILKRRRQRRRRFLSLFIVSVAFCIFLIVTNGKSNGNSEVLAEDTGSIKIQSNDEISDKSKGLIVVSDAAPSEDDGTKSKETTYNEKKNGRTDIAGLKNHLENYASGYKGKYGIYFLNLVTGEQFGINDKEEYIAASTVKMPLNLYLYKMIKEGNVKRDGILTYLKEDYEEGTGEIRYGGFGKQYAINELARLSIEKSDNVATNMLFRFLDKQKVKNFMVSSGGMVVKRDENITCPRDLALYMKLVYDFYKKDDVLGKELMRYFENTDFNDRIPALLPKDVRVAHKTGNQVNAVHDVGVVFADKPYIISIMSKDVDEVQANGVIANISKKVFDSVKNAE